MEKKKDDLTETISERINTRKKFLTYKEASIRYGFGETKLREMAKACKALYVIGGSTRINMETFDSYMETFLDET